MYNIMSCAVRVWRVPNNSVHNSPNQKKKEKIENIFLFQGCDISLPKKVKIIYLVIWIIYHSPNQKKKKKILKIKNF